MQPIERTVERLRDVLELVLGPLDRDARVQVTGGHVGRRTIDAADRGERAADEEPAAGERDQQRRQSAERSRRGEGAYGFTHLGQVAADEDERTTGGGDRQLAPAVTRGGAGPGRRRDIEGDGRPINQIASRVPHGVVRCRS